MLQKKLCCILCCIAILCLAATSVFASDTEIKPEDTGSICYDFNGFDPAIVSGSLELRRVADFDFASKTATMCPGYEDAVSDPARLFEKDMAETLLNYAEIAGLPAETLELGEDGRIFVSDLPQGVYLVSQTTPFEGYEPLLPTLISIPMRSAGEWTLELKPVPKLEPIPEINTEPTESTEATVPTQPSTTEPETPPEIPKTGQINWPIPMLLMGGCFLILLGICLRKENHHET